MSRASKYLAVACETCGAREGEPCETMGTSFWHLGNPTKPHAARLKLYSKEAKLEKTKP